MIHLLLGPVFGLVLVARLTAAPTLRLASFCILITALILPLLGHLSIISWTSNGQLFFGSTDDDDDDDDDDNGVRIINAGIIPAQPPQEQLIMVTSGEGENQQFLIVLPPSMTPGNDGGGGQNAIQARLIRLRR